MTTASRNQAVIAVVWLLVVALITVTIFEHGQARLDRASMSESLILMDRALQEIVRSDSAVVRMLRFGTQAPAGVCGSLANTFNQGAPRLGNLEEEG